MEQPARNALLKAIQDREKGRREGEGEERLGERERERKVCERGRGELEWNLSKFPSDLFFFTEKCTFFPYKSAWAICF